MTLALAEQRLTSDVTVRPLTRRESHWITDRFVDHVVYGMLDREWEAHRDG